MKSSGNSDTQSHGAKISEVLEILLPSDFLVHQNPLAYIILQVFTHSDYLLNLYRRLSLQFLWAKFWEIKRQTAANNNS